MTRSLLVASVLVFACRSTTSPGGTTDAPGGGGGGGVDSGGTVDAPAGSGCTTYSSTTIAAMRMAETYGCYELDDVIMTASTSVSSTGVPKLFVEDSGAGAYSAIELSCSTSSSTHPCTADTAASVKAIGSGAWYEQLTVKGTYTHSDSGFEAFYPDSVTDGGAGTTIAPGSAALADIERSGTNTGLRFQHVTAELGSTKLVVYDWTPAELTYASGTCTQDGFALIGSGVATPGPACAGSASQPASPGANSAEILIGTDFYHQFHASSDCACNGSSYMDTVSGSSAVTGSIGGMLLFETETTGSGYYYLDPTGSADAAITNLIIP